MDKKTLDKSKIMKNALKKMRKKDIPKPESKNNRTRSTPPHTKSTPFNPSAPKISLVIPLAVCHLVLLMLVWRIWYWIN